MEDRQPIIDGIKVEQVGFRYFASAVHNGMILKEVVPRDVMTRWPELNRDAYLYGVARRIKKKIDHIKRISHD